MWSKPPGYSDNYPHTTFNLHCCALHNVMTQAKNKYRLPQDLMIGASGFQPRVTSFSSSNSLEPLGGGGRLSTGGGPSSTYEFIKLSNE